MTMENKMSENKINLEALIVCPECNGKLDFDLARTELRCQSCSFKVQVVNEKPIFTPPPDQIRVTDHPIPGEEPVTPWRQANWVFLKTEIDSLPKEAVVLDMGSGSGYFSQLVQQRTSLAVDIYPYPGVDIVCDLTNLNPFRENCLDAVVLMNVLEHIFDTDVFLAELTKILKPGGKLIVAIPFLLKEHQQPLDFVRFTQFSLERLGEKIGLGLVSLEGYYDPMFLFEQGTGNFRNEIFWKMSRPRNYTARLLLFFASVFTRGIGVLVGKGYTRKPADEMNPAPIGYHVVYQKEPADTDQGEISAASAGGFHAQG